MVLLIDEMMDAAYLRAARQLDLKPGPVDLVGLAAAAVEEAQRTTNRHGITIDTASDSLVGTWDGARLSRVLGNLLGNAIKYSPDGGEILVRLWREEDEHGAWALLAVRDEGVGIPALDLPLLFERFRRGANVAGRFAGTGIGLAGAKQVVEQHGGAISVTSAEGRGATFTVRLPMAG